ENGQREHSRQSGSERAVAEGGNHLVVRDHRPAGYPGANIGELGGKLADPESNRFDAPSVVREVVLIQSLLDEKKKQALVRRKVVSRVRVIEVSQRKPHVPGRDIDCSPVEASHDLVDEGAQKSKIRLVSSADPQVEEAEGHGVGELLVEPLQEPHQGRPGGVAPDEFVVVEQSVAESDELVSAEIEQPAPVEETGVDSVGDARRQPLVSECSDEAVGVSLGTARARRLDNDNDVVQLRE